MTNRKAYVFLVFIIVCIIGTILTILIHRNYSINQESEVMYNYIFNKDLENKIISIKYLDYKGETVVDSKEKINKFFQLLGNTKLEKLETYNEIYYGGIKLELMTEKDSIYLVCFADKINIYDQYYKINQNICDNIKGLFD